MALLTGCASEPSVPLPGLWEGDDDGSVLLRDGGTGEVANLPGRVDGEECEPENLVLLHGAVEWEEVAPGEVVVTQEDRTTTLWADRGGFGGDVSWFKVSVGPCGENTPPGSFLTYFRDQQFVDLG